MPELDYRRLGSTGLRVSSLAFGTMSFGGDADAAMSERLYAMAREAGITLFDCANVYNGGESERLLGRFSRLERDKVVITTKVGFPTGSGPNDAGSSGTHVIRELERSLARLGTDYVDVHFLHRWDPNTPLYETVRALEDARRAGKIRYVGVSNFSAWQTMKAIGVADALGAARPVCIQPMYSLVKRQAEVELLPMAASEGLGVLPYSPLGGGLLSGKYGTTRRPVQGRLTTNEMYAARYGEERDFAAAESHTALALELGVHPAALAVAWVMSRSGITAPLIGARSVEQLEPLLTAPSITLTEDVLERLANLVPAPPLATDRSEEQKGFSYERHLRAK
jgi:aryl-alcohol dehydrogenase-like predicted oxidoreductase